MAFVKVIRHGVSRFVDEMDTETLTDMKRNESHFETDAEGYTVMYELEDVIKVVGQAEEVQDTVGIKKRPDAKPKAKLEKE